VFILFLFNYNNSIIISIKRFLRYNHKIRKDGMLGLFYGNNGFYHIPSFYCRNSLSIYYFFILLIIILSLFEVSFILGYNPFCFYLYLLFLMNSSFISIFGILL